MAKIYATPMEWNQESFSSPAITAYPEAILHRLLRNVPASAGLHPRIRFYDADFPDAFVLPGGQIYISRQIAEYLHGEDGLAALVAHEMGHALTHQATIEFSQAVREQLRIDSLPDQESVLEAFNRLLERESANVKAAGDWAKREAKREEPDQEGADRTALYLLASAGYPPHAMVDLFNEIARTHGKTGGWLANLFRLTTPDQQRLRALEESLNQLPASCRRQPTPASVGDFSAWRERLKAFNPALAVTSGTAPAASGTLQPGLPGDLSQILFSPNGQYLMTRDPSGILVFSARPLRLLFRIAAPDATDSSFTSDSRQVQFHTNGLRVEKWDIATRKRVSLTMAVPLYQCWKRAYSPDGRFLAVMACDGTLSIMDESTGRSVFSKSFGDAEDTWEAGAFSPDGRYFVATRTVPISLGEMVQTSELPAGMFRISVMGVPQTGKVVAVDMETHHSVHVGGTLKDELLNDASFLFLSPVRRTASSSGRETTHTAASGPDTLVSLSRGLDGIEPEDLRVFGFPSGRFLGGLVLATPEQGAAKKTGPYGPAMKAYPPPNRIGRVTGGGGAVLLFPLQGYPAGLLDLAGKVLVAKFPSPVVDVFGSEFAMQHEGWLRLDDLKTHQILGSLELPTGLLGPLKSAEVSPDLKWLAISDTSEGAVYSLADGRLIDETPEFSGSWFGKANALYADFPEINSGGPTAPSGGSVVKRIDLEESAPPFHLQVGASESQYGPFLLDFRTDKGKKGSPDKITLEVHSLPGNRVLWKRSLPERPPTVALGPAGRTLLLGWRVWPRIHVGLFNNFDLTSETLRRYLGITKKDTGNAFQMFDAKTGKVLGHFFLPGLLDLENLEKAVAMRDELVVSDRLGRTEVFSWKTGWREGMVLGRELAVSSDGRFVCLADTPRQLRIARLPLLFWATAPITFSRRISMARFSRDGRRLFVLTRDQRFFIFRVPPLDRQGEKISAE